MSSGEDDIMSDGDYDDDDYDYSGAPEDDAPLPDESYSYERSSSEEGGDSAIYPVDDSDRDLDESLINYIRSEDSFGTDLFANTMRLPPYIAVMPGTVGDLNREVFSILDKSRIWVNQIYRSNEVLPKISYNLRAWDAKNEAYTSLMGAASRLKSLITRISLLDGTCYIPPATLWTYLYFFWYTPGTYHEAGLLYTPEPYCAAPDFDTMYPDEGKKKLKSFDDEETLAESLAKRTVELSTKFVKERGTFTVVLSGSFLVKALSKLVQPPYLNAVDWSKWHVFFLDEWVVPQGHADDSIYKLAFDEFLSKVPIPPNQVYAMNGTLSAEGASEHYENKLKELVNNGVIGLSQTMVPRFDLILMGMGSDGHVGSLFSGNAAIREKEKWITFVKDCPVPPKERITMTLPLINAASYVSLMVTGVDKAAAVDKAHTENGGSSTLLPIQMVSLEDGVVTWFTDKPAVSILFRVEPEPGTQVTFK